MALSARFREINPKSVIVHSDRGCQYCSAAHQKLLKKHWLICSMCKKGDCYDNAAIVSDSCPVPMPNNRSSITSKCITI